MKFQSKPFKLFFLIVFCLAGLEIQTAFLHIGFSNPPFPPLAKGDTGGLPFPCQGHGCGCKDADDCRSHCCCSKTPSPHPSPLRREGKGGGGMPAQTGISYFAKTLHCRGVHTDIPIGHLTQYEPLIDKIMEYILADCGTLLLQKAEKPLEPYLSPPYKPPENIFLTLTFLT